MSYESAAKYEADRAAACMRLANARANLLSEVTGFLEGLHLSSDRVWRAFVEFRAAENLHRKHAGLPLLPLPERSH